MRVRVKPGHITVALSAGFTGSLLITVGAMILQPPAPLAASPLPHVQTAQTTAQVSDLMLAKHAAAVSAVKLEAVSAAQAASPKPVQSPTPAATTPAVQQPAPAATFTGVMSCTQVENLWISARGPSSVAVLMAEIAGAESGRDPNAPFGGLWQIQGGQPVPGNINDPMVNADNAVAKYNSQGLAAWTTYTSGAYQRYPC